MFSHWPPELETEGETGPYYNWEAERDFEKRLFFQTGIASLIWCPLSGSGWLRMLQRQNHAAVGIG